MAWSKRISEKDRLIQVEEAQLGFEALPENQARMLTYLQACSQFSIPDGEMLQMLEQGPAPWARCFEERWSHVDDNVKEQGEKAAKKAKQEQQ